MIVAWLIRRWKACDRVARLSLIGGALIGAAVSWWLNQPVPPWIEFHDVQASYEHHSKVVRVIGEYTAVRTCSRGEIGTSPDAPEPLIWRQEVRSTGAQVAQYAPSPASPTLQVGRHQFETTIPLEAGIQPDGWSVAVLVSCDTEPFAVRSKSVLVRYWPAAPEAGLP